MPTLEELVQQHDADDVAVQQKLADVQALLMHEQAQDLVDAKTIADLQAANKALTDKLAKASTPTVPDVPPLPEKPQPTGKDTEIGACPRSPGGTSTSVMAGTVALWGSGTFIRNFFSGLSAIPYMPAGASGLHASWKPASLAAITDQAVATATAHVTHAEVWHEADVKDNKYDAAKKAGKTPTDVPRETTVPMKNKFYDACKRVAPHVKVVNTVGWWGISKSNKSTNNRLAAFSDVKADILGLDCDGVDAKMPMHNFADAILESGELVAFLKNNPEYSGIAIPELSSPRDTTKDKDGKIRAAWLKDQFKKFADLPERLSAAVGRKITVDYITLFDYNFSNTGARYNKYDTPAETAVIKEAVAAGGI